MLRKWHNRVSHDVMTSMRLMQPSSGALVGVAHISLDPNHPPAPPIESLGGRRAALQLMRIGIPYGGHVQRLSFQRARCCKGLGHGIVPRVWRWPVVPCLVHETSSL